MRLFNLIGSQAWWIMLWIYHFWGLSVNYGLIINSDQNKIYKMLYKLLYFWCCCTLRRLLCIDLKIYVMRISDIITPKSYETPNCIVGLLYKFTHVKMKGPNKSFLNLKMFHRISTKMKSLELGYDLQGWDQCCWSGVKTPVCWPQV